MKAFFPPQPEGLTASFSRCIDRPECPSETLMRQLRQRDPPPSTLHLSMIDRHLLPSTDPIFCTHMFFSSVVGLFNLCKYDFFLANMNILCHNFNRKKNIEHRRNIMEQDVISTLIALGGDIPPQPPLRESRVIFK